MPDRQEVITVTDLELLQIAQLQYTNATEFTDALGQLEESLHAGVVKEVGNRCLVLADQLRGDINKVSRHLYAHPERFVGNIFDYQGFVDREAVVIGSFLGEAVVRDEAVVIGSCIENSIVGGNAHIRYATLLGVEVHGGRHFAGKLAASKTLAGW